MAKKNNKMWLAEIIHPKPHVTITDWEGEKITSPIALPNDCIGIMYVFRTKTSARKWSGKKVTLRELEQGEEIS